MIRFILPSFLIKLIVCPLAVILSSYLFPGMRYSFWYEPIAVGVILAGVGAITESVILRPGTLWIATGIDFIMSTLLVYFISLFFDGGNVSFSAAILTGFVLTAIEYFTHRWLIQNWKSQKSRG